jgi:hypothetical protein
VFWPRKFAKQHRLNMQTPLLIIERRIRCATCNARIVHVRSENYTIKHGVLGEPRV